MVGRGKPEQDRDALDQRQAALELERFFNRITALVVQLFCFLRPSRNAFTSAARTAGLLGFVMKPSQPAAWAALSYIGMACAVRATTGMEAVLGSAFNSRVKSSP